MVSTRPTNASLLERAGVEYRWLYDSRHAAASLLLAQGVAPQVVMETLGHSDPTTDYQRQT